MKRVAFFAIALILTQALVAQEASSAAAEDEAADIASSSLGLQISSLPEAKLTFTERFKFPFLQGDNALTEGNNIELIATAELTPVTFDIIGEAVWTPVAFFELSAGGRIGSGWPIKLFGGDIYGSGINRPDTDGKMEYSGSGFDGALWKVQAGATFQMDYAALKPGDWNHIVFQTYHEINYKGYSRADAGESWYFENDDGENINGWNYYGSYVIGYQMPILLNMVALLTESELYLYDDELDNRSSWGDELIRWKFAAVLNFEFTKQFSTAIITQFRTVRNYKEPDWKELYYRNRTLDSSNPRSFEFYRVAAILAYKF